MSEYDKGYKDAVKTMITILREAAARVEQVKRDIVKRSSDNKEFVVVVQSARSLTAIKLRETADILEQEML